jgi:hypothetical protein
VAALGARSTPAGLGRHRGCYDPRAKGILSQVDAESRTIADLIKVAETYALLAVAEALQFSLVKIARGPAADSGATSLDRAANGQYLAQRLIQVCARRIWPHRLGRVVVAGSGIEPVVANIAARLLLTPSRD